MITLHYPRCSFRSRILNSTLSGAMRFAHWGNEQNGVRMFLHSSAAQNDLIVVRRALAFRGSGRHHGFQSVRVVLCVLKCNWRFLPTRRGQFRNHQVVSRTFATYHKTSDLSTTPTAHMCSRRKARDEPSTLNSSGAQFARRRLPAWCQA